MSTYRAPVAIDAFLSNPTARALPGFVAFEMWLRGLADGFACPDHPREGPSVEARHDGNRVRIVCAPCRAAYHARAGAAS